jgi:hypothetical protein
MAAGHDERMSDAGPPQGANDAPSGGVGVHMSDAGPPQGASDAPSGGVGVHISDAAPRGGRQRETCYNRARSDSRPWIMSRAFAPISPTARN